MVSDRDMEKNEPVIEIKFGTYGETLEEIRSVYVRHFTELIKASRGNMEALTELEHMFKEGLYIVNNQQAEILYPKEK